MSEDSNSTKEKIIEYSKSIITNLEEMITITKENITSKGLVGATTDSVNNLLENTNLIIQETRKNMENEKDLSKLQQLLVPLINSYDTISIEVPKQLHNLNDQFVSLREKVEKNVEFLKSQLHSSINNIASNVKQCAVKTVQKTEEVDAEYNIKRKAVRIITKLGNDLDRRFKIYKRARVIDDCYHFSSGFEYVSDQISVMNEYCYGFPALIFSLFVFVFAVAIVFWKKVYDVVYSWINGTPYAATPRSSRIVIYVEDVDEPYIYFWNCSPTVCPAFPGVKLTCENGIAVYELDVPSCSVIISNKKIKSEEYQISGSGVFRFKDEEWSREK